MSRPPYPPPDHPHPPQRKRRRVWPFALIAVGLLALGVAVAVPLAHDSTRTASTASASSTTPRPAAYTVTYRVTGSQAYIREVSWVRDGKNDLHYVPQVDVPWTVTVTVPRDQIGMLVATLSASGTIENGGPIYAEIIVDGEMVKRAEASGRGVALISYDLKGER